MERNKRLIGLALAGALLVAAVQWLVFPMIRARQMEVQATAQVSVRPAPEPVPAPTPQKSSAAGVTKPTEPSDLWLILLPRRFATLSFRGAALSQPTTKGRYQMYGFSLSIVSDYAPLVDYLDHLESSDPKVVIENMRMMPEEEHPSRLLTKLQGVIYVPR
jgi:hypothetical protein